MRVLVTGSRKYSNYEAVRDALRSVPVGSVVIHGAAKGADELANLYALTVQSGLSVMPFPALWVTEGKAAGFKRNTRMLDEGRPEVVMAFVADPTSSPGTANMIMQSLCRGLGVWLFDAEGNLQVVTVQQTRVDSIRWEE